MEDLPYKFAISSRRKFLKTSAGAAASLLSASTESGKASSKDASQTRPVQPSMPSWARDLTSTRSPPRGLPRRTARNQARLTASGPSFYTSKNWVSQESG